jgi:ribonuclease VapC
LIVDTSALVAVLRGEEGWEQLLAALYSEAGAIPAPVVFELHRVTSDQFNEPSKPAIELVEELLRRQIEIVPLTAAEAMLAAELNHKKGTGNMRGGSLNLLDLMVYAMSVKRKLPILCTGFDYANAEARIHPASRRG